MAEINTNLDTTPLPPNNLVAKDPESAELAGYVRTKTLGGQVREAIARSIELNSTRSKDAENLASETLNVSNDLKAETDLAVKEITKQAEIVIANATQDSEVILARGGKTTLSQRLDDSDEQLNKKWNLPNSHLVTIKHNLDFYPELIVLYSEYGIDTVGFEETPEGISFDGTSPEKVDVRVKHITRKEVEIYVNEEYVLENFDFYTSKDLIVLNNGVRSLTIIFGNVNHENMLPVAHSEMLKLNNLKIIGG